MNIIKKLLFTLIILLLFFNVKTYAEYKYNTILIICSYNSSNTWENKIIEGLKQGPLKNSNYNLKFEYLDVASFKDNEFYHSTSDLLNLKYKKENIDLIVTIDDEAFDFVRYNLFNKDSFLYKHKTFFIGVNKPIILNFNEKDYISGIIYDQKSYQSINLIAKLLPKVNDIYIVLANNIYSQTIQESINSSNDLFIRNLNIHYITSNYMDDITEYIQNIDNKHSAILLCGNFYRNDKNYSEKDTINTIKEINNIPIFTTLYNYIENGAIGGYINDDFNIGIKSSEYINMALINNQTNIFYDAGDLSNKCVMNFPLLSKNGINPILLPNNTNYINKGMLDLPFPLWLSSIIWVLILSILSSFILFIFAFFKNKKLKDMMIQDLNESKEREKIKTDFLIVMSHELRTPLNIILNTSNLLHYKIKRNEYDQEFCCSRLEYISTNANRLLRSVNNSIDVAKLDAKVYDTNYNMVNVVEIIDNIVDLVAIYAEQYEISIIFDPEKEEISTAIDIEKLEKILLNLISNSIKNMINGGSIFIKCNAIDNNILISVEDNGRGIPNKIKNHIFDKYFHSPFENLSRSADGSGIGLYIVKKFIDILDGSITFESTVGIGTTFYITLPIKKVDTDSLTGVLNKTDKTKHLVNLEFAEISKRKK